jgi:hypothetical protein
MLGDPMKWPEQNLRAFTGAFEMEEFNLGTY